MRPLILAAALSLACSMAVAAAAPAAAAPQKAANSAIKNGPDFDMGQAMAVFDKIFPAQPDPVPARLALSRTTVTGLLPDGTYARMMSGMMQGVAERVMALSDADFGKKPAPGKAAQPTTLRQQLAKDDPHFEERMRITQRVMGEELGKVAAIIEPKLREGLARSMARRFDEKQLADINAFLATDSGRSFGSQSMAMWVDPDVMRGMISSFPEVMKAMPSAMKRLENETAHLPKAKSTVKVKPKAKT